MEPTEVEDEYFQLHLCSEVTGIPRLSDRRRMLVHIEVQDPTSGPFDYSFAPNRICESEVEQMLLHAIREASLDLDVSLDALVRVICWYCSASLAHAPVAASDGSLQVFAEITFQPAVLTEAAVIEAMMRRLPEGGGLGRRPAAASAIENLGTVIFRREEGEAISSCVICLEDFEPATELSVMPCDHRFHCHCLTRWLGQSFFYPLCRMPLQRDD